MRPSENDQIDVLSQIKVIFHFIYSNLYIPILIFQFFVAFFIFLSTDLEHIVQQLVPGDDFASKADRRYMLAVLYVAKYSSEPLWAR